MSLVVLCPSRGRPQELREVATTLVQTRVYGSTRMLAVIDSDDPLADEYVAQANSLYDFHFPSHEGGMVNALNAAAKHVIDELPDVEILGFVGDDHRFRTMHWDREISIALEEPGYAYGYDGFWQQGELPTQIFISKPIVKALGYYALPDCQHLFVDNAWRAVAETVGRLHYLPEVYIEHMHPAIGKAKWDEGHKRVNTPEMYGRDGAAFSAWRDSERFADDVGRVRQAIGSTG
jgi:hypothetical protein